MCEDSAMNAKIVPKTAKNITIVFWESYIGVAPSIRSACIHLADAGYQVNVIIRKQFEAPSQVPPGVQVFEYIPHQKGKPTMGADGPVIRTASHRKLGHVARLMNKLGTFLDAIAPEDVLKRWTRASYVDTLDFILFTMYTCTICLHYRPLAVFGVDVRGGIAGFCAARLTSSQFYYWSLELSCLSDFKRFTDRLLKRLERWSSRRAAACIVQDHLRASALIKEHGLNPVRIVIVPNAPCGVSKQGRSNYLREKLAIPSGLTIVLHAGMISPATCSLDLAAAAASWPDNYCLVFHERIQRDINDSDLQAILSASAGKAYLSLNPVPLDQLDVVISSADIGIVVYNESLGPNFSLMAGASGKLAYYLRDGLPVVCVGEAFRQIVESYGCGVCVLGFAAVRNAVDTILADYDRYSANAKRCYSAEYEFSRHFERVIASIEFSR